MPSCFSTITLTTALLALLTPILAQNLTGLPPCGQTCFVDGKPLTSCDLTNATCLCADSTFEGNVTTCVENTCDTSDIICEL